MRDAVRPVRVLAGGDLDQLVAELDRDRALDDIEALVLGVVDVQQGLAEPAGAVISTKVYRPPVSLAEGLDLGEHAEEPGCLRRGRWATAGGWMKRGPRVFGGSGER